MTKRDLALDLYNTYKGGRQSLTAKTNKRANNENPETIERVTDPKPVGELLDELIKTRDWQSGLAEGEIFVKWAEIVGDEIASKSEPVEIKNQKLFIQCASTAWATQLNLVKLQLLTAIQKVAPGVMALEILGPNAPSWRKGFRTTQGGKGPRDTYG